MSRKLVAQALTAVGAVALIAAGTSALGAQGRAAAPPAAPAQAGRAGGAGRGGGGVGPELFPVFDANKDGAVTSAEIKATFDKWYADADTAKAGSVSQEALTKAIDASLGTPAAGGGAGAAGARGRGFGRGRISAPFVAGASTPGLNDPCGGRSQEPTTPCPSDVQQMMAVLPTTAPAKPLKARKVLIFSRIPSAGFQHSSIPLAAKAIEELGKRTGAWTSDTSWDSGGLHDREPQAVRRDLPLQHDRMLPRHGAGCGAWRDRAVGSRKSRGQESDRRAPRGVPRVRA